MPARHQQRDKRKFGLILCQQGREQMPFQMMHGQHGLAQRECQAVGIRCARQQCAAQARPLRVGDGINVGVIGVRLAQRGLGERH